MRDLDKMCYLFVEKDTGKLNFSDFIAAIVELKGEVTDELIAKSFDMIAGRPGEKFVTR